MTKSRFFKLCFLLVLLAGASACKTKRVVERSPLINISTNSLLDLVDANNFDFKSLSGKLSVNSSSELHSGAFKVNMRIAKDSAIWLSVTPALGIEAARILIDQDSVKFIDKLKSQYFVGGIDAMDTILAYAAGYPFLENLLIGNPVEINPEDKYTSFVDGLNYVLQTKSKRKLRKAVDLKSPRTATDSVFAEVLRAKKYEKVTRKYSEDDLILKRYFIRPGDFKVETILIDDILLNRALKIYYSRFEVVDGIAFPMQIKIEMSTTEGTSTFDLEYTRIKTNEAQSYPFKIPDKYSTAP